MCLGFLFVILYPVPVFFTYFLSYFNTDYNQECFMSVLLLTSVHQKIPKILRLPSKSHHNVASTYFTSFIFCSSLILSCLGQAAITKHHSIYFLRGLEAGKSKSKVEQGSVAGKCLLPGFQTSAFSLFSYDGERDRSFLLLIRPLFY